MIAGLDAVQRELCAAVRPGIPFPDLHRQAHHAIARLLHEWQLVQAPVDAILDAGVTLAFFPHGLGHLLGIQVHDLGGQLANDSGGTLPAPPDYPRLRLTRTLEAGQVVTIEPGVYFIDSLLGGLRENPLANRINWERIGQLKKYGGIRIEDDVLVTGGPSENLTGIDISTGAVVPRLVNDVQNVLIAGPGIALSTLMGVTTITATGGGGGGIPTSIITAKGDLIAGTAANTPVALPIGTTDGHVLTVCSACTAGMYWAAGGGGGATPATPTAEGIVYGCTDAVNFNYGLGDGILSSLTTGILDIAVGGGALATTDAGHPTLRLVSEHSIVIPPEIKRLQPANPTYQPILNENPKDVEIQGKVVMVIRQVDTLRPN